jgi:beta-glucosidase/6-phospho-beta-glucosidase/beta-galactosidase
MKDQQALPPPQLFRSFWLAGFESSCHINRAGVRLDMLAATQHDRQADADYALLRSVGIHTVRDGIRWPLIERRSSFDFSSVAPMVVAAQRQGIQVIWDIFHYGWPDDLDIFAPAFVGRFARFCGAVARFMARYDDAIPFYVPINELSFFVWAAAEVGLFYPYAHGRGAELKCQLVRAAIAGIEAIWAVDSRARIIHIDPVINVVAPRTRPDLAEVAAARRASQFEAWDMLTGRMNPELGGHPRYLDVVAVNYYHANQWEHPGERLRWEDTPLDERWVPFWRLLSEVYERYRRPLFVGETGHFGAGRARWLSSIAAEVYQARAHGVPVAGVCLYPILDRPDWEDPTHWHNCGLWDLLPEGHGHLRRVLHADYAESLRQAQALLAAQGCV